jgi:hypothetical protein
VIRPRRFLPGTIAAAALLALADCAPRPAVPPTPPQTAQCLARLHEAGVRYEPATPSPGDGACAIEAPVLVSAAAIPWNQPGVVSCVFAERLADFAQKVVEPVALARLGERVGRIRHRGTYACRRENGGNGRWSQHASGNAIDIAGFELESGVLILVERDWRSAGPKREFLREIARRACERFSVVLTPDTDREHHDHIHLDIGPYKLCGR